MISYSNTPPIFGRRAAAAVMMTAVGREKLERLGIGGTQWARLSRGGSCHLVLLAADHTEKVVQWRSNPDIAHWFFSASTTITAEMHLAWLEQQQSDETDLTFIIASNRDGGFIGMIALYRIDLDRRTAEFGRLLIGETALRRAGYAFEAIQLVKGIAREMGLLRIYLSVLPSNIAAIRLYEKNGFRAVVRRPGELHMEHVLSPVSDGCSFASRP